MSPSARVAVTGVGVVSALGACQEEFWSSVLQARSGICCVDLFDPDGCQSRIAGQAPIPRWRRARRPARLSRSDAFCLPAVAEALQQAGLTPGPGLARFGVSLGCTTAGMLEGEEAYAQAGRLGWSRCRVSRMLGVPIHTTADVAASFAGAGGPRLSNMTACSSATLAIGLAADLIRSGQAEGMIAGGADALCRLTFSGFNALRLLDPEPCRPFDTRRAGLSLGEGAGILILEPWERAVARGAPPLAEFLEYGASCDAHHMTAADPEGRGALAAMAEALERAGVSPAEVDYVNAHGTGTTSNDAAEVRALLALFGEGAARPPVSSTKSMIGHLLGGAGGVEAVTVVLALRHQTVPPTLGIREPEGGGSLDFVPGRPRRAALRVALSNSFGFGGANACLVFRSAESA